MKNLSLLLIAFSSLLFGCSAGKPAAGTGSATGATGRTVTERAEAAPAAEPVQEQVHHGQRVRYHSVVSGDSSN